MRGQVAKEHGHLDILVNNAGVFENATWEALDLELWQRVMSVDQAITTNGGNAFNL